MPTSARSRPRLALAAGGGGGDGSRRGSLVDLIASSGERLGIMSPAQAMRLALEEGLSLVEINSRAKPPVCKIMDLPRYSYAEKKKAALARGRERKPEGE